MMTMAQFEEEKARLITLYGGTGRDASGKRAQAFALLYAKSKWKTEALAETEKTTTRSILRLCIYGRFLLGPNGSERSHIPERRFRDAWQSTDQSANEEARFAAVDVILATAHQEHKPERIAASKKIGKQLIAEFSDGKFHRLRDMAEALDADMSVVRGICDRIVSQGTFQTFGERRPAPPKDGSYAYRFVKGGKKKIDLTVLRSEVQPVLDDMQMVISGPRKSDFTREAMQTAFAQLLKVLDSIAC